MGFFAAIGSAIANAGGIGGILGKASQALPFISGLGGGIGGGPQNIDMNRINSYMAPTQNLVNEQLGLSRGLMDPNSDINQTMKRLMAQRAQESGAQAGSQMMRMGAMKNLSPAQTMMQARMAMNSATSGVNQNWLNSLNARMGQGLGLMGNMTQMQQGLGENQANAYLANLDAQNQSAGPGPLQMLLQHGLNQTTGGM
tara:strand:+ start:1791 stop:2387 length:597 start_codon:yes stop_codon:yes gene_type:complete